MVPTPYAAAVRAELFGYCAQDVSYQPFGGGFRCKCIKGAPERLNLATRQLLGCTKRLLGALGLDFSPLAIRDVHYDTEHARGLPFDCSVDASAGTDPMLASIRPN